MTKMYVQYMADHLIEMGTPLIIFLAVLIAGYVARKIIFNRLLRWAKNTKTEIDDIIIEATKGPFIIWCLMLGLYFALKTSQLHPTVVLVSGKVLMVLGIASATVVLAHISSSFIKLYTSKYGSKLPVTSLTQNISRVVISVVGILVILHSLGISIAPILATLGVGGLAVALALQDTMGNFFSGFHIIANKQVMVGDYIKLETGIEGYVIDINWRTTKIRMPSNNEVLVPNTKIAQAVITNFSLPNKETNFTVDLSVHYNSDLEKVERVSLEVARQVMREFPGGVPGFEPLAKFTSLGDSGINLTVVLRVMEFGNQFNVRHEFIKRLVQRFSQEGIVIPYPVRAINYSQEKAGA